MKKLFLAYLFDEEGQTSTEYILLVAIVVIIVLRFKDVAQTQLGNITENIFGKTSDGINRELDEAFGGGG